MKFSLAALLPLVFQAASASAASALAPRGCTSFTSAVTHLTECCDETVNELFWIDKPLGLGICCLLGSILEGFVCVPQKPPPTNNSTVCSGEPVCPHKAGSDLGIEYGHCYVLQALNGLYLGHDSATKYEVDGENPGVVFRVCHVDNPACDKDAGTVVGTNGTWWMQDQMGDPTGTGFGWLGGSGDLSVQDSSTTALVVGGSPLCFGGKCSVCITFPPGGAHAPCPLNPGQSHLGVASNPNSCQPFIWQEVQCRSEQ